MRERNVLILRLWYFVDMNDQEFSISTYQIFNS